MGSHTVKEIPVGILVYYKHFKDVILEKLEKEEKGLVHAMESNKLTYNKVKLNTAKYNKKWGLLVTKYPEFCKNIYINGAFAADVKIIFDSNTDDREDKFLLITILRYANTLKNISDLRNKIALYKKLASLTKNEYIEIVSKYYVEVQRNLILKGYGYQFPGSIGFLCINRCKLGHPKPMLDYKATKVKKEQLLAEGKTLFNKKDADRAKALGVEYDGVDYRVFLDKTYQYEFALCYPKGSGGGYKEKFYRADTRGRAIRGKTNEELLEETNGNIEAVMQLPVDIMTKLHLCLKINKMLYTKFIRNENQKTVIARADNR